MDTREFNRLMKYAFMNDDPYGVLSAIYDNELPHPYFNPKHIGFSKLRSFDHNLWLEREKSDRTIVFEDLEYIIPGEELIWNATGTPPCTEKDIDAGMSTDAIIGKHANKRTDNTDEIRKIIQRIKFKKFKGRN